MWRWSVIACGSVGLAGGCATRTPGPSPSILPIPPVAMWGQLPRQPPIELAEGTARRVQISA